MCLSDFTELKNNINSCEPYSGILNQLSLLCTSITALTNTNECATGAFTTTLVAATDTQLEFSDVSTINTGVLVGDTFVTTLTGLYYFNLNMDIPTTGVAENLTLDIQVNGVSEILTTLVDDGLTTTTLTQPNVFYMNLTAGDIVTVLVNSPTGAVDATGTYSFEAVYGV